MSGELMNEIDRSMRLAALVQGRNGLPHRTRPAAVSRPLETASGLAAITLAHAARRRDLSEILLARGTITRAELVDAQTASANADMSFGDVLEARGILSEADHLSALGEWARIGLADLTDAPPDPALAGALPCATALELEAVPWRRAGSALVVATCRPGHLTALRRALPQDMRIIPTLAPRSQITDAQIHLYGDALARIAEGQAPQRDSCRGWRTDTITSTLLGAGLVIGLIAAFLPTLALGLAFGAALLIFSGNMVLKLSAFAATLRAEHQARMEKSDGPLEGSSATAQLRQPVVSLLVPLYKEREIASALVASLARLDYPPEKLDVLLAIEADDHLTRQAVLQCHLPPWIRPITVPPGHPRTKPRALNFALNFARGAIIGIYDAEDRPEPDQINHVVQRFAEVGPEVACLQGRLDYYNANHNWIARSFAIEYASWFRVLLPGVQRLGLFVPLGGTTLFIRRDTLRDLGGWDAHNVTEDAELGLRIARNGYRTEMIDTTTHEEANAAVWPWIAQRARWQKGYLMTWGIAMRRPTALWRELGPLRFVAFQVQVLFAVLGFLVAPLLWSLVVKPFGVSHPLDALLNPVQYAALAVLMVTSLLSSWAIAFHATRARHLRRLRPWVLLTELYYILATISAWRAAVEMLVKPFWWAKTAHGRFGGTAPAPPSGSAQAGPGAGQPFSCASSLSRTTNAIDR